MTNDTQRNMYRKVAILAVIVWFIQAVARGKLNRGTIESIKKGIIELFRILKGTFERSGAILKK